MSIFSSTAMAKALRLTRNGDLAGVASHLIDTFNGGAVPSTAPSVRDGGDLATGGVPADSSAATAAADRFERRSYRGAAGTLDYQLFIPAAATAGMPLVVMLHGCSQSPKDFARGTRMNALAAEFGFLVAYPGQTSAANGQRCWNWFKPGDQQRDRGEPALIAGVTQDVIAHEAVDPARVYIAGLSAGGAAAAILAATYPELYAAVGIHSGVAYGAATDLSGALVAMHNGGGASQRAAATSFVPVITFHGDRDPTVHEKNSRNIIAAASTAAGVTLETVTTEGISAGGRGFTNAMSADVAGRILIEQWTVHGAGHAWAGGDASASYTDAKGPDASREMLRFFMTHRLNASYG